MGNRISASTLASPLLDTTLADGDTGGDTRRCSNLETCFNICNNYVGMVLLSMHFCFARCGWLALPTLALLTAFGAWTGVLLIHAYRVVERQPLPLDMAAAAVPPSYAKIGASVFGDSGVLVVVVSSVVETFVAIVCMDVIIWSNAVLLLPSISGEIVVLGCIAVSFPTVYLRNFSVLSSLSAVGIGAIFLILAIVCFKAKNAPPASESRIEHTLYDLSGLPMAASIMLAGLTGHVGLPPMYAEMRNPEAFTPVLCGSFAAIFVLYAATGVCGYLLYGDDAAVLITTDMYNSAGTTAWADRALVSLVVLGMTIKLFCGVPLCVITLVDIGQSVYHERNGVALSEPASDRLRLLVWASSTLCSLGAYSCLEYVTAVVGINSMIISILLPILFYIALRWHRMRVATRTLYALLLLLSVAITAVISWVDVEEFAETLRQGGR